jgi:hypothetical protein
VITYRLGNDLDLDQVIDLYRTSTLGERRPLENRGRMSAMLQNANLVITAWDGDLLVGLSHQRCGIGKELIRQTQAAAGPQASLILAAAPAAVDYYPRIGFKQHPSAWVLRPGETVR